MISNSNMIHKIKGTYKETLYINIDTVLADASKYYNNNTQQNKYNSVIGIITVSAVAL